MAYASSADHTLIPAAEEFVDYAVALLQAPPAEVSDVTDELEAHRAALMEEISSMSFAESRSARLGLDQAIRDARQAETARFFSGEGWEDAPEGKALAARIRGVKDSEEYASFSAVSAAVARTVSDIVGSIHEGKSNRARRAARASDVLSKHAGLNTIPGLETDSHGNALTDAGDLCPDGSFGGQTSILILQMYPFDMSMPIAALERKGLVVKLLKGPVSLAVLEAEMGSVSQLWIISSQSVTLSREAVDKIVEQWREGLALYVFGDNAPYFADANWLLKACGLPTMSGNELASKVVGAIGTDASVRGGFVAGDLATTGIVKLFEGITIATLDDNAVEAAGMLPVLREHETGKITVARRPAIDGAGPVVVDGAFTKLFCNWDDAGSARFVTNMATLLAVDLPDAAAAAVGVDAPPEVTELDLTGALRAECDITYEDDVACVALRPLDDSARLTADVHLDNALGCGRIASRLVLPQVYGLDVGRMFAAAGSNPFTREPLHLIVPAVSLRSKANRQVLAELCCHGFLGGAHLPQKALHLLHSACQEMVVRGKDEKGVFRFLCEQLETHTFSTGTFTDEGTRMRLRPAMHFFSHSLAAMEQRKVFSFCEAVAQAMLRPKGADVPGEDEDDSADEDGTSAAAEAAVAVTAAPAPEPADEGGEEVSRPVLRAMLRRSLLRTLVSTLVQLGKSDADALKDRVEGLLVDRWCGVLPVAGTAKVVGLRAMAEEMMHPAAAEDTLERAERIVEALGDGKGPLMSDADVTYLLAWALHRTKVWTVSGDSALLDYLATVPGRAAWVGEEVDGDPRDAVSAQFRLVGREPVGESTGAAASASSSSSSSAATEAKVKLTPLFVTPMGPSAFVWADGRWLADPTEEGAGEDEWLEGLRVRRRAALRATYASHDPNGYPHRAEAVGTTPSVGEEAEAAASVAPAPPTSGYTLPSDPRTCLADLTGDAAWLRVEPASAHSNLHRAVQAVMTSPAFAAAAERTPAMEEAVARYLRKDGKGNVHDPSIRACAPALIDSYLQCRRAGMEEPRENAKGQLVVSFDVRVRAELAIAAERWEREVKEGKPPVLFSL